MKRLQGRVAVITGAGSGFGLEFARLASKHGMRAVLADIQPDALERTRAELEGQGTEVLARVVDVARADAVEALAQATLERFGSVHLVFNNAGVGAGGFVWENSLKDWEWVLGVNLWGVIHGVHSFVPRMLERAKVEADYEGHVVNTASMAGIVNAPTMGVYNVSKHAVVSLTETLHHDLRLTDAPVSATVLCPYYVTTGIHESERNRPADKRDEAALTPAQRVAGAMTAKAVTSATVTAAEVAESTFQAIAEDRFYVFSHPHALNDARARMDSLVNGRNPEDPFAAKPEVREKLKAKLRGG